MNDEDYQVALKRNLNEVVVAKLEYEAYREMSDGLLLNFYDSFFTLAQDALFNDMIARMIKVLDKNSQSTTFWYIFRYRSENVKEFIKSEKIDFMEIYDLAGKLKTVRDKTHFHIDKKGVKDPRAVWTAANITYDELKDTMDYIYRILNHLHVKEFDFNFEIPKIDDLQYIINVVVDAKYAQRRPKRDK